MRYATMAAAGLSCLLFPGVIAAAQEPPVNAELVGHWDGFAETYADVWGTPGIGYIAHFGDAGVHILDLADPSNPTALAHYRVPPNSNDASAQDVKVYDGLMFVGLESEQSNSIDIVDVRDPADPQHLSWIRINGDTRIHNCFYDNGWLYLADSETPRVVIVDLRNYDPDNPPAEITQAAYTINDVGGVFVHDITVQDGRLYACAWDSGLWVYDVSNLASQPPTFLGSAPGSSTHSCWVTSDNKFVVTGEERGGGGIKVWEIADLGSSVTLTLRDQLVLASNRAYCVHNQTIIGNRLYNAWYGAGLQVFDIDPGSGTLEFVASYDTSPAGGGGFDGAWGVFPFNGEDEVLVSDLGTGFWVIDVDPTRPLEISFPDGVPTTTPPNQALTFAVQIEDGEEMVLPGSETLYYRTDPDGAFSAAPLVDEGGGLYRATIPPQQCQDEPLEFYVSAEGDLGTVVYSPEDAPAETYEVVIGVFETLFMDTFETDQGWIAENLGATSGEWQRGVPVNDPDWEYDPGSDSDGSGQCYLTQNETGNTDVDGGAVRLTSPTFDMSQGGTISYDYYLYLSDSDGADRLLVEVSDDGPAGPWREVQRHTSNGGLEWRAQEITADDLQAAGLNLTANMQIRFTANDSDPQSIVEAGIDAFLVSSVSCDGNPPGDMNCDGTLDGADIDPFFLALGDPGEYASQYPDCNPLNGDINGDNGLDGADIDPFFACLGGDCP